MKKLLSLLTMPLVVTTIGACSDTRKEPLKLAALPVEVINGKPSNEFELIAEHIGIGLGREIEIIMVDTYAKAAEMTANGELDLVLGGTQSFWEAEALNNDLEIFTTFAPEGDIDQSGYKSIIGTHVTNKTGWEDLTEQEVVAKLKGESFSFNSQSSTSGGAVPQKLFWDYTNRDDYSNKADIFNSNEYLGEVVLTNDHDLTVKNILDRTTSFGAFYDAQLKITTDKSGTDLYDYVDMYKILELHVPGSPLWGNLDSSEATKMNDYLGGLDYNNTPELYDQEEINFNHPGIKFVSANKSLKGYQNIKTIDEDAIR